MINKDFKTEWAHYGGTINVFDTKHFSFDIDKEFFSISISVSWVYRMIYIGIGHLIFRIY